MVRPTLANVKPHFPRPPAFLAQEQNAQLTRSLSGRGVMAASEFALGELKLALAHIATKLQR